MPKKSKKEKIRADFRRKAYTEQVQTTHVPTVIKEEVAPIFKYEGPTPKVKPAQTDTVELTAIKHDLYKTFSLAVIALATEVGIYFLRR